MAIYRGIIFFGYGRSQYPKVEKSQESNIKNYCFSLAHFPLFIPVLRCLIMSDERSQVLATNEAFYRAFEKKDIEAMSAVWSQGTGSRCIHPGRNVIRGWKDIHYSWEQIFKNTSYLEIDTEILTLEVRDTVAYIIVMEKVLQVSGGRRTQAQSIATNIFERMASSWYLVHHHGSPLMR